MENKEICNLYLCRDENAIVETEKKYKKYLLKIAMNILGNREDAEECLNDTFTAAWNSIRIKAPDDLKHYLARIIKNKALHIVEKNTAGKRGGGQLTASLDELEEVASSIVSPEKHVIAQNDSQMIESFLDTLPEIDRKVFVRRYWFYDKISDISDRYDISGVSVKVKLSSCRKKLKKYLLSNGYEE